MYLVIHILCVFTGLIAPGVPQDKCYVHQQCKNCVRTAGCQWCAEPVSFSLFYELHLFRNNFEFFHTPTWTVIRFIRFIIHISCTPKINSMLWNRTIIPANTNFGPSHVSHFIRKKRMYFFKLSNVSLGKIVWEESVMLQKKNWNQHYRWQL
jgi:hypothetical protein